LALGLFIAFHFYSEVADRNPQQLKDPVGFVDLRTLPPGWNVEWAEDAASERRVTMTSPRRNAVLQVLVFQGDLDKTKFDNVEKLLFDVWPSPVEVVTVQDYGGRSVRRASYIRQRPAKPRQFATIDVVWHEAKQDFAYVVIAQTQQRDDPDVTVARSHLQFYPPHQTIFGRARRVIRPLLDRGDLMLAVATWLAAIGFGLAYAWTKLDRIWKPVKYLAVVVVFGASFAAKTWFNLGWIAVLVVPPALTALIGIIAAVASGRMTLSSD